MDVAMHLPVGAGDWRRTIHLPGEERNQGGRRFSL